MKRRLLWLIAFSLIIVSTIKGQGSDKSRINEVKKDTSYLYGEATLQTKHDAIRLACDLLKNEVKKWSEENNIHYNEFPDVILSQLADTIAMNRSNKTRAFVYVKKSALPSAFGKKPIGEKKIETAQTQIPNNTSSPIIIATQSEQPESTSSAIIVATQPQPSESAIVVATQPQQPDNSRVQLFAEETPMMSSYSTNTVIEKIKAVDSFYDLKSVMLPLHEQGAIKSYGKYSTMQNPVDCYLVIYDSNGYIKALLGKGTEQRLNLKTLQPDSEKNYPGCGAIWFQLSNN